MSETGYGIKLIYPEHLYPYKPYFDRSLGPDRPALMNFNRSPEGFKLATSIRIGDRALVYVTRDQLFIWAIEFAGTLKDGEAARLRHGIPTNAHAPFTLYLPIRFLARIDPWDKGATRTSVCYASGVDFHPTQGDSHVSLSQSDYERMYRAIKWTAEPP
jgi:hypothetical protein